MDASDLFPMRQLVVIIFILLGTVLTAQESGQFTDPRDGQVYKTVKIGKQVWMAENLNYKSESNKAIFRNNTDVSDVFGRLYTWEIAQEVCPDGWHLPSDEEWVTLAKQLGGETIAGSKMKEASKYWVSLNEESSNTSGFSALPGGFLEDAKDKTHPYMGEIGFFWSTEEKSRTNAFFRYVKCDTNLLKQGNGDKKYGVSVRCLKD